jgi:predicted MFS family arabinose efflux permease
LLALAQARALWLVVAATALVWFSGGFVMALVNVLTGLAIAPEARGRAFSLLFLASPVAAIFGGGALGAVVNAWGYAPGFVVLALLWALIPLVGWKVAPPVVRSAQPAPAAQSMPEGQRMSAVATPSLGRSFTLLLVSSLAVAAAIHLRNVSAFLQMQSAGFSPAAISSTTVTAGVVTVPVALFAGSLSDRIGRRTLMIVTTALVILTLIPLAGASEQWHFAAGIALLLAATAVLRPAATAVATDLLPSAALKRGLPLVEAGVMGVGIVAAVGAGYVLERFGAAGITVLSVLLLLVSALSLALLCSPRLVGAVCPTAVRGR